MPRICSVCVHPMREYIEEELLRNTPLRDVAQRFGLSATALCRHRQKHLPEELAYAEEAKTVARASTLLEQVQQLRDRALRLLDRAERAGDLKTAVQAVRATREVLTLLGQVAALAQEKTQEEDPLHRLLNELAENVRRARLQREGVDTPDGELL